MCTSPIHIKNPSLSPSFFDLKDFDVPCGHCHECQEAKKLEWYIRCRAHIKQYHDKGFSVFYYTLTYNEDFLPVCLCNVDGTTLEYPCFSKSDVQGFLKRLRTYLIRRFNLTFTYFITSEYGHLHHRPHYHCLFFIDGCLDPYTFKQVVKAAWSSKEVTHHRSNGSSYGFYNFVSSSSFGFVKSGSDLGLVKRGSEFPCQYVAKYIGKDIDCNSRYVDFLLKNALVSEDSKCTLEPFHLQSSGFGLYMIQDVDNLDLNNLTYRFTSLSGDVSSDDLLFSVYPLPRYILRHLFYYSYVNENGNVSYKLTPEGISKKIATFDLKISRFVEFIYSLDSYSSDFFKGFEPLYNKICDIRSDFPNLSHYFEFYSGSIEFLAEYAFVYRGRPLLYRFHNYKNDITQYLSCDLPFPPSDCGRDLDLQCDYLLKLINLIKSFIKFVAYDKNVKSYNSLQRVRSKTSSDLRLLDELDFPDYCKSNKTFKHEYITFELGSCNQDY